MGTATSRWAQQGDLLSYVVRQPVSRAHGLRGVNELGFLTCWAGAQPIVDSYILTNSGTAPSSGTVPVPYKRGPGERVLLVEVVLDGTARGSRGTLTVTSDGTVSWITGAQGGMDGTTQLAGSSVTLINEPVHRGFLDVSQLTVGTLYELRFNWTNGNATIGIKKLKVIAVPLVAADPTGAPTDEPGLDGSWPDVNRKLIDGTGSTPSGFRRWVATLDQARSQVRRHITLCAHDVNAYAWSTTSASFVQGPPLVTMRPRKVYEPGAADNVYTFVVTYRTSDGSTTGEARVTETSTNSATATLTASTSRTTATATFNSDTSPSSTDLTFEMRRTSGSGTIYISGFALIENES